VKQVLSQRGLNRATLARQYLLERVPARAIGAIEHLAGLQATSRSKSASGKMALTIPRRSACSALSRSER